MPPDPSIDAILARVQGEIVKRRGSAPAVQQQPSTSAGDLGAAARALATAVQNARAGEQLPPMHKQRGFTRAVAQLVAKLFLRMSQLFMRDQRAYNAAMASSVQSVISAVRALPVDQSLAWRIAELEGRPVVDEAALKAELAATRDELSRVLREHTAEIARLRTSHLILERRIATLVAGKPEELAAEKAELAETLYSDFEAQFRGSWNDIKQRVSEHLPAIREAGAGTASRPVVDLGSGRGEWLSALHDAGLAARGVELSKVLADEARKKGLEVVQGDAVSWLRGQPAASVGAITGLHLVEHLPLEVLVALLGESLRVLAPGGVAIFETPNPENLLVGACNFYLDPTHLRPLHPELLRFLAEAQGFVNVEIRRLHPAGEQHQLPGGSPVAQRLNQLLYGPQDYAIVARRAA